MKNNLRLMPVLIVVCGLLPAAHAADHKTPKSVRSTTGAISLPVPGPGDRSVAELAESAKASLVVISHFDRDRAVDGVGTGFVVGSNGLIATSFHVIGEGRPITVQFADGRKYDVTEVYAWDRKSDLAVIRIGVTNLTALPLGDSDTLKQGAPVVALGNPLGLDFSVVQGVVSARRDIETSQMIQLAIPVEPGNSGGPLLDMQGRVHGVLTLKSAVTRNLGFAMPVNDLKPLLERPNPVPMNRWLTIGTLNTNDWTTFYGAKWSQRNGRILVEGTGDGFGGRSLCLSTEPAPKPPFDITVTVKLDDESGAAGLIFCGDGGDRHFGFYPSGGRLRLTRFEGPNYFSWQVLREESSPAYRPGDWNNLRVHVENERVSCYVNDQLVTQVAVDDLPGLRVGLAKFRETKAEFKKYAVGRDLLASRPTAESISAIEQQVLNLPSQGQVDEKVLAALDPQSDLTQEVLQEKARSLDKAASRLRQLADTVQRHRVETQLKALLGKDEDNIDLFLAALWVAKLDNPDLDPVPYQRELDQMAKEIRAHLPAKAGSEERLRAVTKFLFVENGFHGSRNDYYNRANSYISDVMDDREGIPISLSVLYMELCRRVGTDPVVGIPLPGHFIVRYEPKKGAPELIDVFDGGKVITREDADLIVQTGAGGALRESDLAPATKKEILLRMLRNLVGISMNKAAESGVDAATEADPLRYLDVILAIAPDSPLERWSRAMVLIRMGDRTSAKKDLEWLLNQEPPGIDLDRVSRIYRSL